MKRIILAVAVMALSFNSIAGDEHGDKYCAKMKDGKMVVMHNGMAITSEAKLNDGSVVQSDGTVVMKDGSKMTLNDGQCISKDGSTTVKKTNPTK